MRYVTENKAKYLSVISRDKAWGLYVTGIGCQNIPAKCEYSLSLKNEGRILDDYSLMCITQGQGMLHTVETGKLSVNTGDVLLLFPGVWHNYRPDESTGWTEYWILFNGVQADRMIEHDVISTNSPVIHIEDNEDIEELFAQLISIACSQPTPPNPVMSSLVLHILARALAATTIGSTKKDSEIQRAKYYLEEHVNRDIDFEDLAISLGLSYRHFRRLFKDFTGVSPKHYHNLVRINRAKDLLVEPLMRINEAAARLGFTDPYYFSRLFRKHTGLSPRQWRSTRGQMLPQESPSKIDLSSRN